MEELRHKPDTTWGSQGNLLSSWAFPFISLNPSLSLAFLQITMIMDDYSMWFFFHLSFAVCPAIPFYKSMVLVFWGAYTWTQNLGSPLKPTQTTERTCVLCVHIQSCQTLRSRGLQPARLFCPQGSPGKNPGKRRHFLLQGIFPT